MLSHIAVIMDGNGRWAKARNLPVSVGHKKGAQTARSLVEEAARRNIPHLTIYAFSAENWQRDKDEVSELMDLLGLYLKSELNKLHKNNVRLEVIGDTKKLPKKTRVQVENAVQKTVQNSGLRLTIALSYGGRQEIINAIKKLDTEDIASLTPQNFSNFLDTGDTPDPDLLIRTGGDVRLSNFLLWQCAYTELYFTETLWPDFDASELQKALDCFHSRERRFGNRPS